MAEVDIDSIALSAAQDIALMWGQDRSQFVAKIQVRIIEAIAPLLRAPAEKMEAARCPPTYRREEAVKAVTALGWKWDGKAWIAPAPAEKCGMVVIDTSKLLRDVRSIYIGNERPGGDGCDAETWDRIEAALAQNAQGEAVAEVYLVPEDWGKHSASLSIRATGKLPPAGTKLYTHAERARVPEPIIELAECRKVGWNDSAPAYRAGWNACRDAMLATAPAPDKEG